MRHEVGRGWRPETLRPEQWRTDLTPEAVAELRAAVEQTRTAAIVDLDATALGLGALRPHHDAVRRALDGRIGPGFAVLGGLPARGLDADGFLRAVWLLGAAFGLPVTQSRRGDFVGHVRRSPDSTAYRGYRSAEALGFHADLTPLAALACRRQARRGGESALVSTRAVHDLMLAEAPDLLEACYRDVPQGRLGEEADGEAPWSAQPLFAADGDRFGGFYNRTLLDHAQEHGAPPLDPTQRRAIDALGATTERPDLHFRYVLQEGEVLFLANYQVMHGRSEFEDHDEPDERRHLLRLWWDAPTIAAAVPEPVRYLYVFGNVGLPPAEAVARGVADA